MKLQEDVIVILPLSELALSGSLEVFGSLGNSKGEEVQEYTFMLSIEHFRITFSLFHKASLDANPFI